MLRFLGGCVGRLLGVVLLVAVVGVAWYNRHELVAVADRLLDREVEASEELAADALVRLEGLMAGERDRVAFHTPELQSLLTYVWAGSLPDDVVAPKVGVGAGRVTLEGDVPTAGLGRIAELREILSFLPDTATLRAVASFVPLDTGHVALEVHELGAAGIPIPKRLIPPILDRFRAYEGPDPGPNALAIPLPPAVGGVYVSGDSLVITAREAGGG